MQTIKTWQERLFAHQPEARGYPAGVLHECGAAYKDAEIADLRAALASQAESAPVAYHIKYDDFQHFSGATATGRSHITSEKPVQGEGYFVGCDSLVVTPLYPAAGVPHIERDAARLDFVLDNSAFICTIDEGMYQLMTQDEDEDYHVMSGPGEAFRSKRDAVDAAMEAQPGDKGGVNG